jgi:UDP-N-acetylglucosamine 2-epimerase (non-hydrolysing)
MLYNDRFRRYTRGSREVTERPEGLTAGTLVLAGVAEGPIYDITAKLLTDREAHARMANIPNPFGDGRASARIIDAILGYSKPKT